MLSENIEIIEPLNISLLNLRLVKSYLKITHDEEDELITNFITVAIDQAQIFMNLALTSQVVKLTTILNSNEIKLNRRQIQAIRIIRLLPKDIDLNLNYDYSLNILDQNITFTSNYKNQRIYLEYIIGYSDKTLPSLIRQGLLMHIMQLYEHNSNGSFNDEVKFLYSPYRIMRL